MTISKGKEWGLDGDRPDGLVTVASDRALHEVVDSARRAGEPVPPLLVSGGDLARTIGTTSRPSDESAARMRRLPIDLLRVERDGTTEWAASHVVARRSWWRGPVVAVMNAEFLGRWDVAPRSHPNDGRADVIEVDGALDLRQRWMAWRRLPTGNHLPHPAISERRRREAEWTFGSPVRLAIDGIRRPSVRHLRVIVEPDAAALYISLDP